MAGAEIGNIKGEWSSGALHIRNLQNEDILVLSSTGVGYGGVFSGFLAQTTTFTAAQTLTSAYLGKLVITTTDAVAFTLPVASTSRAGWTYTIINMATSGGAAITVSTADNADLIVGNGKLSTDACNSVTNTKTTQKYGDRITIVNAGAVLWSLQEVVGTWALS
jgi:hypothetical protein